MSSLVDLTKDLQEMIVEIESIETTLVELKANTGDDFKATEESALVRS